jgi:imidazolonepropionase
MNLALINIRQLVTVESRGERVKTGPEMKNLGILENAGVIIEGDHFAWIGRMEDLPVSRLHDTDVLDCIDRVVMPGFVDAHTHLVFGGSREDEFAMRSSGATYQEIGAAGGGILSTVRSVRQTTKKELKKRARAYLTGAMRSGTTTIEIKSGYGLDPENETKMLEAINELNEEEFVTVVPTFLGAHAIPPEFAGRKPEYVELIIKTMLPYIGKKRLARFCDVFCEQGYFNADDTRRILAEGLRHGLRPKVHADELTAGGGAEIAAEAGAVSADHLEQASEAGIRSMAAAGVVGVLLPGVSFFLNHGYAPARRLIDSGVPVAIASDFNPGSCMSYSMPLMMTIACTHMRMAPEEAITASTLNAAAALGCSGEVGSIEIGKKADCIVLDIPNYRFLPYFFGENHVEKVVKNGVILEF